MPAATAQDRCEALTERYRGRERCTAKAVGTFERTRTIYRNVPNEQGTTDRVPQTETQKLGRLCRRHANQFNAKAI